MRLLRPLAAVGLLAACGGSVSALGSNQRSPCNPPGSHTLASDASARVFSAHRSVFGCSRPTGRLTRLGHSGSCLGGGSFVERVALAGEIVAYGDHRCGVDTGFSQVVVLRLTDGRRVGSFAAVEKPLGPESITSVSSLVARPDGAAAWIGVASSIVGRGRDVEVRAGHGEHRQLLDSGAQIDPGSLRLHGSRLTWRHGPATRSATLS